jgi:hypothetical protein
MCRSYDHYIQGNCLEGAINLTEKKKRKKIVDFPFLGKTKNLIEFT